MQKKRILIIDDEPSFTMAVKINLEETGRFDVATENLPLHAIEKAREFHPELILLDIVMPGSDGASLKSEFEKIPSLKDIPVVFLTALVSETGFGEDGNIMIGKPAEIDQLISVIDKALERL